LIATLLVTVVPNVPATLDATSALCVVLLCALPLAHAGLAILNTGLGRSRSAAQSLLGSLCVVAVAAIAWFFLGFSIQGYPGGPLHSFAAGSASWDWLANCSPFFRGIQWNDARPASVAAFQIFAVGLAALIPWGSGADRWRLGAGCAAAAVLAALIYPLFGHWVWGDGWLAQLGANFHLGSGFADPGGAGAIHALGGFTALALVWIVGSRRGKFPRQGPPAAIPAHNIVYVLFGCMLAFAGWLAFNTLGAFLFAGIAGPTLMLVPVNTLLCASGAVLAALLVARIRFGKPDASICANGWVAGLVVSSAVAALVSPAAALFSGIVAGATLPLTVEFLELRCGIDDPSGAIAVHGVSGIWGLFALGLLSRLPAGQTVAQLVGIGTLLGLVFPLAYGAYWLLNRVVPFRTDREGERIGMDLHELGAGAYPEFAIHNDEFIPR